MLPLIDPFIHRFARLIPPKVFSIPLQPPPLLPPLPPFSSSLPFYSLPAPPAPSRVTHAISSTPSRGAVSPISPHRGFLSRVLAGFSLTHFQPGGVSLSQGQVAWFHHSQHATLALLLLYSLVPGTSNISLDFRPVSAQPFIYHRFTFRHPNLWLYPVPKDFSLNRPTFVLLEYREQHHDCSQSYLIPTE